MNINLSGENYIIQKGIAPRAQLTETKLSPQVIHLDQPGFNTSYGYEETGSRRGYTPTPINITSMKQATFKYNPAIMAWTYSETKGRGKTIETPVATGFESLGIIEIYNCGTKDLRAKVLTYTANGRTYSDTIPGAACNKEKYSNYITGVNRLPGCTKILYNELWSFLVRTSLNVRTLRLYEHQGWNLNEDGSATFNSAPIHVNIPIELFPVSVLRRKSLKMFVAAAEVISRWEELYSKHPTLKFLSYFRIGSLLQFFLNNEGVVTDLQ